MKQHSEFIIEHQIFWMLTRRYRRPWVGDLYLTLQIALGLNIARPDLDKLLAILQPEGSQTLGVMPMSVNAADLAFFHWLYEVELHHEGSTNYHDYLITRRYDGATVLAEIKTESAPRSWQVTESYERQLKSLTRSREQILAKERFESPDERMSKVMAEFFPDAVVLDLSAERKKPGIPEQAVRLKRLAAEKASLEKRIAQIDREMDG